MSLVEQTEARLFYVRLEQASTTLGLNLSTRAKERLIEYVYELAKWNRTYNLTALKTVNEMLVQHVFDCLAVVPTIDQYERSHTMQFDRIADVGSGAGLPAAIIAICRPTSLVYSIDAVEKKTAFVANIANKLGLSNLIAQHCRVEDMCGLTVDLVISRAFATLAKYTELVMPIVGPEGVIAAMKSKQVEADTKDLNEKHMGWIVEQIDPITVPELQAERCIAWLRRK
jgi:16S rRNA (guanine527-N7)-methyltransferase